ncbi:MAG TPA: C45 family autoproteolytic acyltransferase/hydrolase [bacterium]|nr:C45 family autoproteolytic acyltransferase/hydrolase [bacterium]HQL61909.1 C45 family autoproteolytic acyltransferase/hydrolase [bacterium]
MRRLFRILFSALPVILLFVSPAWTEIVAREGAGYLEKIDGRYVLHLSGDYYEIGYQHGVLLKDQVKQNLMNIVDNQTEMGNTPEYKMYKTLRGAMHARLKPFIPQKYMDELKGLADGAGLNFEDVLCGNLMPEAFHCSGIALFGKATRDGSLYHVRILDYMTKAGLQDLAVIMIVHPKGAHGFMNVSYAGSLGSVTGMNDAQITIGEMGGKGQGFYDGMPMPLLLRDALERAGTLEEAMKIFQETPRTCEYYYVISDAKIPDARGVYATPAQIAFIEPGSMFGFFKVLPAPEKDAGDGKVLLTGLKMEQSKHQILFQGPNGSMGFMGMLPENTVVISGEDRYRFFLERLDTEYGKVDETRLMEMIKRPVSMKSNLHCAIFHPATAEAWVAHAASDGAPACDQTYHHYVLEPPSAN